MKACPYCLEEIRDEALKCRYCGSFLKTARTNRADAEGSDSNRIVYNIDRDLVRFAKYAVWCLLGLIVITVILYLYGFHTGRFPAKPEQVTYTFVIDGELYRFVKVAGAVLAIFVTVGVFLYGFEIKKAAKEARDSADSTRQARYDVAGIKEEMQADQAESKRLLQQAEDLITSSKDAIGKMAAEVAADREKSRSILADVQTTQDNIETSRQQAQSAVKEVQAFLERAEEGATAITRIQAQYERSEQNETGDQTRITDDWDKGFYTVPQLVRLYDFPQEFDGSGQCIGLIELGGGYLQSDLETYFAELKIPKPQVKFVSVDGAKNQPRQSSAHQVTMDIETAGAVAPGARLVVYMAPNTNKGFLDAVNAATIDEKNRPTILSIAWGAPESSWTLQLQKMLDDAFHVAAMRGITVVCASGDGGATDGVEDGELHVDFPASSPWVLACGGTHLTRSGEKISKEIVWNDAAGNGTGGGVSRTFGKPAWQSEVDVPLRPDGKPGRGLPDVAAHASPEIGYRVVISGQKVVIGGTSASTPLWAGLIARLNQALGRNIGYFNPLLYQTIGPLGALRDITQGNNGAKGIEGYSARPGWDPCTGWGSPNGAKLLDALRTHLTSPQKLQGGASSKPN